MCENCDRPVKVEQLTLDNMYEIARLTGRSFDDLYLEFSVARTQGKFVNVLMESPEEMRKILEGCLDRHRFDAFL